jgi:hypothetical protein
MSAYLNFKNQRSEVMPLPMVHLAVAVQLTAQQQQLPSPAFLLGSIAPDAIHMRVDAGYQDKQRTHLDHLEDVEHHQLQALLAQYRTQPAPLPGFVAGYAAHLLTDRLWLLEIAPDFEAKLAAVDPVEKRKIYYEDTDQVDFNLYHQAEWRPEVWERLTVAERVDFMPLLSDSEIHQWRERTLRWFEDGKHEPKITPRYLTDVTIQNFIHRAVAYVADHFASWEFDQPG